MLPKSVYFLLVPENFGLAPGGFVTINVTTQNKKKSSSFKIQNNERKVLEWILENDSDFKVTFRIEDYFPSKKIGTRDDNGKALAIFEVGQIREYPFDFEGFIPQMISSRMLCFKSKSKENFLKIRLTFFVSCQSAARIKNFEHSFLWDGVNTKSPLIYPPAGNSVRKYQTSNSRPLK
jgi:hypothetical protein